MGDVFDGVLTLRLIDGPAPVVLYVLSAVALVILFARRLSRRWVVNVIIAACGAVVGWVIAWLVSDVWNSVDISLSTPTKIWFAATVAAVAFAIASFGGSGVGTKIVAGISIPLFILAGSVGINADVGEFPVFGDLFGATASQPLILPSLTGKSPGRWVPPADLPAHGRVGTVVIPATVSHFVARMAVVYLPPAALIANAPALPVLELLSGQPGAPSNMISSGQLPAIADSYARAHRGLAPIVVIPDQLGAPANNPMCVDSPLGNSASYLTVDVPAWIHSHLRVRSGPDSWAIGGFSQGGTCAIQLGAKYPQLYGSILDISGQLAPHRGSVSATVRDAFGGSDTRYRAAAPLSLLAAGAPYVKTLAIFCVGAGDGRFGPATATMAHAAKVAGMNVHSFVSPGTAHDWHTVQFSLREALPLLGAQWNLA